MLRDVCVSMLRLVWNDFIDGFLHLRHGQFDLVMSYSHLSVPHLLSIEEAQNRKKTPQSSFYSELLSRFS